MAKMIEGPRVGTRTRYPWNEWANGKDWLLERGKDYKIADDRMVAVAHNYASRHGLEVSTARCDVGMYIKFKPLKKKLRKLRKPSSVQK